MNMNSKILAVAATASATFALVVYAAGPDAEENKETKPVVIVPAEVETLQGAFIDFNVKSCGEPVIMDEDGRIRKTQAIYNLECQPVILKDGLPNYGDQVKVAKMNDFSLIVTIEERTHSQGPNAGTWEELPLKETELNRAQLDQNPAILEEKDPPHTTAPGWR